MPDVRQVGSSVLLIAGVALVFGGLSAALGISASGLTAAVAAIAALLYAGAVWFGAAAAPPPHAGSTDSVLVFDRSLLIVAGPGRGTSIAAHFPESFRAEILARCTAAFAGESGRFTCGFGSAPAAFDAVPIRNADGTIVYGMILDVAGVSSAAWSG